MFVGYPAQALVHNWLHRVIWLIVARVHGDVRSGRRRGRSWQNLLPKRHRSELLRRTGLKDLVFEYRRAFAGLAAAEQAAVHRALVDQNRFFDAFSGAVACPRCSDLPLAIREPARDLFKFAFGLLTPLGPRDKHYSAIYNSLKHKLCPFCGIDSLDSPNRNNRREDDDHYLPKSEYPFAAVNLRNVVPACRKCNDYKGRNDPIFAAGQRFRALDPYSHAGFTVRLENSLPLGSVRPDLPEWQINFDPPTPEAETWDRVYGLRGRLRENILDQDYSVWIGRFASYCGRHRVVSTTAELLEALVSYADGLKPDGLFGRAFLELAVCRMHEAQCRAGNVDVITVLTDAIQNFRETQEKLRSAAGCS